MNKGRRVAVVVGIAAAMSGAGVGFWHRRKKAADDTPLAADDPAAALWQASFERPDGQPLAMAGFRGSPLVLNFWATWCPPCVKEMPELDRFAREHAARGIKVVGLAIDSPTPVRQFLARTPVGYPVALAAFEGTDLSRALGNAQGALPFTAVFDRSGALVHRKLGEINFAELAVWMAAL